MGRSTCVSALFLASLFASTHASAQAARVNGIAWDSLGSRPLAAAFITLGTKSTIADSLGRFSFDSVAPGTLRLSMQHDVLDSLGLSGLASSVTIPVTDTIRLSTPSAASMWRRACGAKAPPDSGFAFGIVRDAVTRQPVPGAVVVASWRSHVIEGNPASSQKIWRLDTRTAASGEFVLCGMPLGVIARLQSFKDTTTWTGIEVLLADRARVQRHDLSLSHTREASAHGAVRGAVSLNGRPVSNVRISVDGGTETRTDEMGLYILPYVTAGTHQIYFQGSGSGQTMRVADVGVGDTATLNVNLGQTSLLDSMRIAAIALRGRLAEQIQSRRKAGIGYFRDSTEIGQSNSMIGLFSDMTSVTAIGIDTKRPRFTIGRCTPIIWIDRMKVEPLDFTSLQPRDIAALEVYGAGEIPAALSESGIPSGWGQRNCAIIVWTKG